MRGSTEAKNPEDSDEKEDKMESPLIGRNVWAANAKSISNVDFLAVPSETNLLKSKRDNEGQQKSALTMIKAADMTKDENSD